MMITDKEYKKLVGLYKADKFEEAMTSRFEGKNFDVMLWVRNILETKYISYGYDFGAVHYGEPRIFGMSFIYR